MLCLSDKTGNLKTSLWYISVCDGESCRMSYRQFIKFEDQTTVYCSTGRKQFITGLYFNNYKYKVTLMNILHLDDLHSP